MTKKFLCKLSDLPNDSIKEIALEEDRKVCVINASGKYYACQAYCPHQSIPLCEGALDGLTLTCLEHLWQWDLLSGQPIGLAEQPLSLFEVATEGDSLYLKG